MRLGQVMADRSNSDAISKNNVRADEVFRVLINPVLN